MTQIKDMWYSVEVPLTREEIKEILDAIYCAHYPVSVALIKKFEDLLKPIELGSDDG